MLSYAHSLTVVETIQQMLLSINFFIVIVRMIPCIIC